MEETKYTNKELAQEYYSVIAAPSRWRKDIYSPIRDSIIQSEIDLVEFYREHNSFKNLKVKGIGDKTKKVLELILEWGFDEAKAAIEREKIEKFSREQWEKIPSKDPNPNEDDCPYWEDSIERNEDM